MSKEYGYLETIAEIFKDKSKRFIDNKTGEIMVFNKGTDSLNIELDSANIIEELIVNDDWINSKWTLIEEKKNYNIRVYGINNSKLISSEIVEMTKTEMEIYCKSNVVWEVEYPTSKKNNLLELGTTTVKFIYLHCRKPITKVVCEEIITT